MQPTTMTLAEAAANLRPTNLLILLLLFLALLRKLGWLPPDPEDDEYTSLGLTAGFAKAQQDAAARINAMTNIDQPTKSMMLTQLQMLTARYQSGAATIA